MGLKMYPEGDGQPCHDYICWDEKSTSVSISRRATGSPLYPLERIGIKNQVRAVEVGHVQHLVILTTNSLTPIGNQPNT